MEIEKILKNIGLTEKEAGSYLALLEFGSATVEVIAKKAQIKRPTTYHVMESLEDKGLVSKIPRSKKVLYSAESPEKIIGNLNRKAEQVKRYLPDLFARYNLPQDKPQVQMFTGKEGVRQIYQEIMGSGEASFFSSISRISKLYPDLLEEFVRQVEENKIKFRDLFQATDEDIEFAKRIKAGSNYQIRFIPAGMVLPSDTGIYGDKVVFFSFQPYLFAVVITSKDVAKSLRTIYDITWNVSENIT